LVNGFPQIFEVANHQTDMAESEDRGSQKVVHRQHPPHRRHPTLRQPVLQIAGGLLFATGVAGIFLPLLPTTVFWIGAAWCWSRSAPHLTRRILSHPRFGEPVRLFLEEGEISRKGKLAACGGILSGYLLLQLNLQPTWTQGLLIGLILTLVGIWLWRRPEPGGETLSRDCDKPRGAVK
jgi:uncharacterized membrane protein YbaN (DUF454 family)